jgi:hypothetical protein
VNLTSTCVGKYCGPAQLHWWVNGKPQQGDPSHLVLKAHQEIAIAYGTPPAHVPSSFAFEPGE